MADISDLGRNPLDMEPAVIMEMAQWIRPGQPGCPAGVCPVPSHVITSPPAGRGDRP
jgi:hypothetical protein